MNNNKNNIIFINDKKELKIMKEKASALKSSKKFNNDEAMYEGGRENTLIKKGGALSETSS